MYYIKCILKLNKNEYIILMGHCNVWGYIILNKNINNNNNDNKTRST